MTIIQQEQQTVHIPDWVRDLATFRRWARSEEFPTRGWYAHLGGQLWVDSTMERAAHNQLKYRFYVVLTPLIEEAGVGYFFPDRMLLTHVGAGLSTGPDGMFVSHGSIQSGLARLEEGDDSPEVEGSPDMVLEVVSPTSVEKDTVVLRDLYWRAGVREYWLADPRPHEPTFDILKRGAKGYHVTRGQGGWLKSVVFGKSFRLNRRSGATGVPAYTLEVR